MPTLRHALKDYDGRNTDTLKWVAKQFSEQIDYGAELVEIIKGDNDLLAEGASWLLKNWLEGGSFIDQATTACLLKKPETFATWQTQLHICQTLQYLSLENAICDDTADWLKALTSHKRPFLRAWALDGLSTIALQHSRFLHAAEFALGKAQDDPSATVRARARAVQRKLAKLP